VASRLDVYIYCRGSLVRFSFLSFSFLFRVSEWLRSPFKRTLIPAYPIADRAFSHAAPAVWNSLPLDIVPDLSCLATFKRLVKTQLYNRAYLADSGPPALTILHFVNDLTCVINRVIIIIIIIIIIVSYRAANSLITVLISVLLRKHHLSGVHWLCLESHRLGCSCCIAPKEQ